MRFKILLLVSLIIGLNLYGFEPLSPEEAMEKIRHESDYDSNPWRDYGTSNKPSFNCYDTKGKYKFKKYSLEDFICQSYTLAFRDNYFADLYNLIIKENPSLKDKAKKIARDRISKTKKECVIYSKEQYDYSFFVKAAFFISESIYCVRSYYREYTAKLALMLYENDKELFKRIYSKDYEYFKEVFEDTIKYVPIEYNKMPVVNLKRTEKLDKLSKKYEFYYDSLIYSSQIDDLLYIVLIQYSLIDENGHLVLPENRKEE